MSEKSGYGLVPASIMRCKELSAGAKALYALLATYADKKRTCFPTRSTICEELGVSVNTFCRYINQLEIAGALEVRQQRHKGSWGSNYYQLKDDVTVSQKMVYGKLTAVSQNLGDRVAKIDSTVSQNLTSPCRKNCDTNNTIITIPYNNTTTTIPKEVVVVVSELSNQFSSIKGDVTTPYEMDRLAGLVDQYGSEQVKEAIEIAGDAGKPKINYIEGILKNKSSGSGKSEEDKIREWLAADPNKVS